MPTFLKGNMERQNGGEGTGEVEGQLLKQEHSHL